MLVSAVGADCKERYVYVIEVVYGNTGSWRSFKDVRDAVKFGEQRARQLLESANLEGLAVGQKLRISLRIEEPSPP